MRLVHYVLSKGLRSKSHKAFSSLYISNIGVTIIILSFLFVRGLVLTCRIFIH